MSFKPNTRCKRLGDLFYSYKKRKSWLLIYYHDKSRSGAWNNITEANNSKLADKYSIIYSINSYKLNDGFEFLLDYPGLPGQNIWFQKNNPLYERKEVGKTKVEGYREISVTWKNYYWGGLFTTGDSASLVDGSYQLSWRWYSIGRTNKNEVGLPGPAIMVNKTRLWIRVPNIGYFSNNKFPRRHLQTLYLTFMISLVS